MEAEKKENGRLALYMVFEFMDCDLLDFYHKCSNHDTPIPPSIIKVRLIQIRACILLDIESHHSVNNELE